jgi:transposase InsO family protein
MSEELCGYIDRVLHEHPALKGSNIIRLMDKKDMRPGGCPSDATIFRYIRTIRPFHIKKTAQERLAFEAPYAGNLYQTDIMYGPYVSVCQPSGRNRKTPTYLLAIIDDYSRLICHAQFFISQDLTVYLNVLEQAIRKRGIPDKIYCDNGKVFLAQQVKHLEAQIGCRIVHTKIRDAAAKGKIERFFGTVRAQFLQLAEVENVTILEELNKRFFQWIEEYNHRKHSSLNCSPMERWLQSPRLPRLLEDTPLNDHLFLIETKRRVKKDGTFSLRGKRYEINYVYAGKKVSVRYEHQDRTRVHVYLDDTYIGLAVPLDLHANYNLPRNYKGN